MNFKIAMTCAVFSLANIIWACSPNKNIDNSMDNAGMKETETIALKNFDNIHNKSNVKVVYTQDKKYSVRVAYTQNKKIRITKEDGTLYIRNMKDKDNNNGKPLAVIYITTPDLKSIKNDGVLHLSAESLKTNSLKTTNSGVSTIKIDNIECKNFDLNNKGVENIQGSIRSDIVSLHTSGVTNSDKLYIKGKEMHANNSGVINMNITFKGTYVSISNSGTGTINCNTDCDNLKATNSGVGKINISGTADKTDINGSGISKINTERLNSL